MKDKKVLVVGMGKSGKAAIEAALKMGASVYAYDGKTEADMDEEFLSFLDKNGVGKFFGAVPEDMRMFDMLILSPGVPPAQTFIAEAKAAGAEIIGELELAYRLGRGTFVAITGTNGKTTTTTLVGEIFKAAGRNTYVGGNIGVPVATQALRAEAGSYMITEVSSFQLETVKEFRPSVSAILNLTEDHQDRHKTMANYGKAKANVFMNQTEEDYCILNYDDKLSFSLAESEGCRAKVVPFSRKEELDFGAFVKDGNIVIKGEGQLGEEAQEVVICSADEVYIPGSHNLENALAAAAIAYFSGIKASVIAETLRTFKGVEHRIEYCGEIEGVKYYNDSKGTNPDAAIKAIEALKKNIILIAGGYDKGSVFDEFASAFEGRVKELVLLGKTALAIKKAAEDAGFTAITLAADMEECVQVANAKAEPGDIVLLSPACASWDMYKSFEKRGEHFKSCVQKLCQN